MHPFRIAVLVFIVGATAANLLALKKQHDRMTYPKVATTEAQSPMPGESASPPALPDPFALSDRNLDPEVIKLRALANDEAYIREAIILTIGGVVWFVVKTRM
jgi:hypothetical protein